MTKEQEYIKILNAHISGSIVKYRYPKSIWYKIEPDHSWNFGKNEYKICIPRNFLLEVDDVGVVINIFNYNEAVDQAVNSASMIHVREVL